MLDVLSCYGEGGAVVSDDAQDLLAGLLQPDPEFRFQSAREVLNHDWLQMKMADEVLLRASFHLHSSKNDRSAIFGNLQISVFQKRIKVITSELLG